MTRPLPRGAPCQSCGLPIRTAPKPKDTRRRYCDRVTCRRARGNARALAWHYRHHDRVKRLMRARYDPVARRARWLARHISKPKKN